MQTKLKPPASRENFCIKKNTSSRLFSVDCISFASGIISNEHRRRTLFLATFETHIENILTARDEENLLQLSPKVLFQCRTKRSRQRAEKFCYFLNCVPKITYLCSKLCNDETHKQINNKLIYCIGGIGRALP